MAAVLILLMLCLALPALVTARSRARRNMCENRLATLLMAVQYYESTNGHFPTGVKNPEGPIRSEPRGMHHGWITQILPYLEEQSKFAAIDPEQSIYAEHHKELRSQPLVHTICPSSSGPQNESDYAACHHHVEAPIDTTNEGVFYLNSHITVDDVEDGLDFTLFLGEKRNAPDENGLGWMSGTRATLRNTGSRPDISPTNEDSAKPDPLYVGGFGSWHAGIAHIAMGDGRVTALSNNVDSITLRQLGSRFDGTRAAMEANGN